MSRQRRVILLTLLLSAPLPAQEAPSTTAEDVVAAAQRVYAAQPQATAQECPVPKAGDEIVVCAQVVDGADFRVPSSEDLDPSIAVRKGLGAPDVGTTYPGAVVSRGCMIPPCPPPMPVLIDLQAIPEAPAGSDADRIARGELHP